jgi:nucleotide-binding universal stress UspA family protein
MSIKALVMKKIMVPTDFTANANKALDFDVAVAKEAKAEVLIMADILMRHLNVPLFIAHSK